MADEKTPTGLTPFTPIQLQEAGVASDSAGGDGPAIPVAFGAGWAGGATLAPQCTVPNVTSWQVRRYHTRHQNYRRYHYHHAPAS